VQNSSVDTPTISLSPNRLARFNRFKWP
jgi:hypothetical protein